jgi:type II secretory pathway pseudopilin PulG
MSEEKPSTKPLETPKKPFPWLTSLLILLAIGALAGLTAPMVIRCPKKADQTEATSNLRQIGLALTEFERDYGSFPNDETAKRVKENHPSDIDLNGSSSNALFRQLFAAEITQSEQMFYANISGSRKPDGLIMPGHILVKDEVSFGYIAGLSTEGNPARPIAFCPIIPGTKKFDPKPFDGKAVILRVDNSVTSMNINKDGYAVYGNKTLFETGEDTVWGNNEIPDIRYPEL